MTILGRLFEKRFTLESPQVPLTSSALAEWADAGFLSHAGVTVNEKTGMTVAAVWRAVNLISGTIASLPLKAYRVGTKEQVSSRILEKPHPSLTQYELMEFALVSMLLWGNAYFYRRRNRAGQLDFLEPILPGCVRVGRFKRDGITERALPSRKLFRITNSETGQEDVFSEYDILHLPGIGYDGVAGVSPVMVARQSLGMSIAAEEFGARLFGNGSMLGGILRTDQELEEKDAEALKRRWQAKQQGLAKSHDVAVLDNGIHFERIGIPPTDAQFIESRRFQISEVARWYGVPPHMLYETEKSTSWGSGIEQQTIGFTVFGLRNWTSRIEQRFTRDVLLDPMVYAKFSLEGLLRGDSAARAAFYRTMREIGALNVDEIRELEDRMPLPDGAGQTYLQPMNMSPLGGEPDEPSSDT